MLSKLCTKPQTGNIVRFLFLLLFSAVLFEACQKDLEGVDKRDKIVASWKCQETGNLSGNASYWVDVTKASDDSTKVFLDNFYQLGSGVKTFAYLNGLSLIIPKQTTDKFQISGTGTISSDYKSIRWTYSTYEGSETDNVTSTYTK